MILVLLLPAVLYGLGEAQTANMTVAESNQTLREPIANGSSVKPGNVTSSWFTEEKSLIEDKLQNNQTSFIKEDDEGFQDQDEFPLRRCLEDELEDLSHFYCGNDFHKEMTSISPDDWCDIQNVIGPYNKMTLCLEIVSDTVGCYYPNPAIQDFFISIHSTYFSGCPVAEAPQVEDAPQGVVLTLTIIPVSLIPVLVYLVVWKSKMLQC